jgi:uncharacterized membrane protein
MSQQELMPEPRLSQSSQESYKAQSQGRQSWSGAETDAQPYNWSRRSRSSDLPKSDHPSTFEDSLPPYSYPAQDQTTPTQKSIPEQSTHRQQQARTHDASAGRGTSTGTYQSYSHVQQQTLWWTQPQANRVNNSRWIGIFLLALVLLVSIPVLCSIGTAFVSVVFVFSLLPVLLAFAPIAFFLLIPLLKVFGPESHDDRRQRSRYDQSWWW